jgi:hypothetical protein
VGSRWAGAFVSIVVGRWLLTHVGGPPSRDEAIENVAQLGTVHRDPAGLEVYPADLGSVGLGDVQHVVAVDALADRHQLVFALAASEVGRHRRSRFTA